MQNCNDTIGNRTRDLPACSAVPQTALPRAPVNIRYLHYTTNCILPRLKTNEKSCSGVLGYECLVQRDVITQACGQTVTFDSPPPVPHNTASVLYRECQCSRSGAVAIWDNRRHLQPAIRHIRGRLSNISYTRKQTKC